MDEALSPLLPSMRKRHPSDLSDEQGALVGPILPERSGGDRHRTTDLRGALNAILNVERDARAGRDLSGDVSPEQAEPEGRGSGRKGWPGGSGRT